MDSSALRALAHRVEEEGAEALSGEIGRALEATTGHAVGTGVLESSDAILLMIDRLFPGWSITIDGVASLKDGHFVVVLRRSAMRDNDPYVGIGKGRDLRSALIAGLLNAKSFSH